MRTTYHSAALAVLLFSVVDAPAQRQARPDPELLAAQAELARIKAARDSVSNQRWMLRREAMDAREGWQVEYERVRDSLEDAAGQRQRLLVDVETQRPAPDAPRPVVDAVTRRLEGLRQDMIDRSVFLRDKIRHGFPWAQEERQDAVTRIIRGIESHVVVSDGLDPLFQSYLDEWIFSRGRDVVSGPFLRATGEQATGVRARVGLLGAWYLTEAKETGLLARSGQGEALYAWHENLLPETAAKIRVEIESRAMDLPVDPVQTRVQGPGYFPVVEKSFFAHLFDFKEGPFSKTALWGARIIIVLLIFLGFGIVIVSWRRNRFVRREMANVDQMRHKLISALSDRAALDDVVHHADVNTVAGRLVRTGFDNMELAPESLEQVMVAQESLEQRALDRGLVFLGNVAANAAFIGLLGTVLGILDAFMHLGKGGPDASQLVMIAIAEALIATAIGLAVAIPAVIFFNNLGARVKKVMDEARELRHLILAACLDGVARQGEGARHGG